MASQAKSKSSTKNTGTSQFPSEPQEQVPKEIAGEGRDGREDIMKVPERSVGKEGGEDDEKPIAPQPTPVKQEKDEGSAQPATQVQPTANNRTLSNGQPPQSDSFASKFPASNSQARLSISSLIAATNIAEQAQSAGPRPDALFTDARQQLGTPFVTPDPSVPAKKGASRRPPGQPIPLRRLPASAVKPRPCRRHSLTRRQHSLLSAQRPIRSSTRYLCTGPYLSHCSSTPSLLKLRSSNLTILTSSTAASSATTSSARQKCTVIKPTPPSVPSPAQKGQSCGTSSMIHSFRTSDPYPSRQEGRKRDAGDQVS